MLTSSTSRRGSPSTSSPSSSPSSLPVNPGLVDLHNAFGRDTPLGRTLFALYTKRIPYDVPPLPTPQPSLTPSPSPHLRHLHSVQRANQMVADRLRGNYSVKVRSVRKEAEEGQWRGRGADKGRKREATIREEAKEEMKGKWRPSPAPVMSAEERKRDLQERMSGMKELKERMKEERRTRGDRGEVENANTAQREGEADEELRLLKEIEERQMWLDERTREGRGAEYEGAIRAEIAGLLRELATTASSQRRYL